IAFDQRSEVPSPVTVDDARDMESGVRQARSQLLEHCGLVRDSRLKALSAALRHERFIAAERENEKRGFFRSPVRCERDVDALRGVQSIDEPAERGRAVAKGAEADAW